MVLSILPGQLKRIQPTSRTSAEAPIPATITHIMIGAASASS